MNDMPNTVLAPNSFGEKFANLTEVIDDLGFDGVLYSFYPKPMYLNSEVQPVLHYSDSFAPFVQHYITNNYGNRDFVLRLALQNHKKAIDWWEEISLGTVSREERVVTEDARNLFGIHHGLSIPALHGTFAVAGISVMIYEDNISRFNHLKKSHLKKLFSIASDYHASIINSKEELRFFVRPLLEGLNDTQKKVLKYLLIGQPMKNLPHIYGITPRYGEKVLLNIRKEFGNISTNELIYILGMVNMHEYLVEL